MSLLPAFRARLWLLPLLVLCTAALAVPAAAGPHDRLHDIDKRQREIERKQRFFTARQQSVEGQVVRLDRIRVKAEDELRAIELDLAKLDSRIAKTEAELTRAQQRLALFTAELFDIQKDLVSRTDLFTARAVAAYKSGPAAVVDSLLSAGSFSELIDRFEYYESALNEDSELLEEIESLRDATELRRDRVEQEKNRIAAAKVELEADRATVAELEAAQRSVVDQQRAAIEQKRAVLARVGEHQRSLAQIERRLQADEARIKAILAAQASSSSSSGASGPVPSGGGQLAWPAAGPLTSGYGYRTHPIFGDTRLHTGIDIGAPYGAPVVAAGSGVVAFTGALGGYGNAIAIDHGAGLATTYNHLSAIYVSSGQRVARGSQIGAVGCTGYCTGPHLHFEVRVDGSPVDPMPYLQ